MSRLARLAAAHGVATSCPPAPGGPLEVPENTIVAALAALGVDASTPRAVREALERHEQDRQRLLPPTVVLRAGAGAGTPPATAGPSLHGGLPAGTELRVLTEDGTWCDWGPGTDLPLGVHGLRAQAPDGRAAHATLIVAPGRFPPPRTRPGTDRAHGLLVQLYSLLSSRSWGMGDLADLAALADWAGSTAGADFLQINPLHSARPPGHGAPVDPSPYRPSSRAFPDPVHLRVEDIPEYARLSPADRKNTDALLERAADLRGAVLSRGAHIDRDAVWALKRRALEAVHHVPLTPERSAAYERFTAARGTALEDHATWNALAELHGPDWRSWPAGLDDPRSARTARAREEHRDRIAFHRRLAWLADEQLARAQESARAAGMSVGLVHDLAVGVHPEGADTWAGQDVFASGMSVGAPPDAFNPHGQNWALPPWRPDALARSGYAPYRDVLTGVLRHAGGVRIDHVMGHSRLWWIPEGRPPTEGTYVHYDTEAMFAVLALEAHRSGAAVIGEDLGTVEPGMRDGLARRGALGTSVLWFERDDGGRLLEPGEWRAGCLATATTHDLPSTAARLTGDHVALRHRLGLLDGEPAVEEAADRVELAEWTALFARLGLLPQSGDDDGAEAGGIAGTGVSEEEAVAAVHRFLARTPARLVGVWLPDTVGDRRPQNVPGTSDTYPNWRLPVADAEGTPVTLEHLTGSPRVHALLGVVREAMEG